MQLIKDFVPGNRRNRPGFNMSPKYITIHDTGNSSYGAGARAHANYLKTDTAANVPVSWHYTVDDSLTVQHIPIDEVAWHAGDGGQGKGNRESIGIEIAMNSDGNREKAEKRAIKLCSFLINTEPTLIRYPDCLKQHWDWTKKNCPQVIRSRANGWKNFVERIGNEMEKNSEIERWKQEGIDYLVKQGIIDSPEYWTDRLDEPMPVWAITLILKRMHENI